MSEYIGHAIIPAAGLGTRMNTPVDGKEMLPDPITGEPLILWSIKQAFSLGYKPVVIVSPEKHKLINMLYMDPEIEIVTKPNAGKLDWPHTVLYSRNYWHPRRNILILPDTRMDEFGLQQVAQSDALITFGIHQVEHEEASKYGIVQPGSLGLFYAVEKPSPAFVPNGPALAWGTIGWRNNQQAEELFNKFKQQGDWHRMHNAFVQVVPLKWFKDITRSGEVERYGDQ